MRTGQFQRRLAWPLLQALLLAAATGHSGLRAVLAAPLDTAWVSQVGGSATCFAHAHTCCDRPTVHQAHGCPTLAPPAGVPMPPCPNPHLAPNPPPLPAQSGGPCAAPPGSCVTFVDALTNPAVRTMYLVSDVNLTAADFAAYDDAPYHLDRDLLVASVPGTWRTLAFNFLASKILIGRNVTVTLADMVMTNTRCGAGPAASCRALLWPRLRALRLGSAGDGWPLRLHGSGRTPRRPPALALQYMGAPTHVQPLHPPKTGWRRACRSTCLWAAAAASS
jgi:hypothetical protein